MLGLERLIDNDPTIEKIYNEQEILETLDVLEDKLADLLAKKSVEEKSNARLMNDYKNDIKSMLEKFVPKLLRKKQALIMLGL